MQRMGCEGEKINMKEAKECLDELGAIEKQLYLGDSVYSGSDGYGVWLITWNGYDDDPRNKIFLEPLAVNLIKKHYE